MRTLLREGRIEIGKNHTVRSTPPHGTVTGTFRRTGTGVGFVRPQPIEGKTGTDVRISEGARPRRRHRRYGARPDHAQTQSARSQSPGGKSFASWNAQRGNFVGTYFERDGQGSSASTAPSSATASYVGDPGAKGAQAGRQGRLRDGPLSHGPEDRGEGVITEVLGPRGQPGVDTLSVIRAYNLPDEFPEDALEEARDAAEAFREDDLDGREDFTVDLVITIDPVDARDFDDAVGVDPRSRNGHWELAVHIADVGHFAPPGGPLDREARKRATSVYLPQRVIPMFPELISNHLASLQQGKVRYVKSALISLDRRKARRRASASPTAPFASRRRFTYEQVMELLGRADNPRRLKRQSPTRRVYRPAACACATWR